MAYFHIKAILIAIVVITGVVVFNSETQSSNQAEPHLEFINRRIPANQAFNEVRFGDDGTH
jgi:uncharacterized membrane protein